MERYFDHVNWSESRLQRREHDLQDTLKVRHNEERRKQIDHELACVAFELIMQERERIAKEEEIAWLEHEARDECPTEPIPIVELEDGE